MNLRRTAASTTLVALVAALTPAVVGSGLPRASAEGTGGGGAASLLQPADPAARGLAKVPSGVERHRLVTIDEQALDAVRAGDRVTLDLFEDTAVTAVVDQRTRDGGTTSWTGHLDGAAGSFTGVEVDGTHHLNLSTPDGTFEVTLAGDDTYRVTEAAPAHVDDDAVAAGRPATRNGRDRSGLPDGGAAGALLDPVEQIDVAIVYPGSLAARTGAQALQAQFALGITQTNQVLANSGLAARVRLVGTRQVAADTVGDIYVHYDQLETNGDGVFDEAHALREETHADLVSLWSNVPASSGSNCGLGGLGGWDPRYDPENAAWTVVLADCATNNFVFAHEIGHNLSAGHDAAASSAPNGKPYAKGYVDVAAGTRTVMAYPTACQSCTRIPYFSSPLVATSAGRVTGTPEADNARAIAEQAPATANYRLSRIYPGTTAITGSRAGSIFQAVPSGWAPANVGFTYQWLVDGVPVPGATAGTFTPDTSLIGRTVTVQVTGSAPYYTPVAAASTPVVVAPGQFTGRPKVKGKARVGRKLKATLRGFSPTPSKAKYQWYRNGKKIKGKAGRKAVYRVTRKDRGKKLRVVVRASRSGYETTRAKSRTVRVRR